MATNTLYDYLALFWILGHCFQNHGLGSDGDRFIVVFWSWLKYTEFEGNISGTSATTHSLTISLSILISTHSFIPTTYTIEDEQFISEMNTYINF